MLRIKANEKPVIIAVLRDPEHRCRIDFGCYDPDIVSETIACIRTTHPNGSQSYLKLTPAKDVDNNLCLKKEPLQYNRTMVSWECLAGNVLEFDEGSFLVTRMNDIHNDRPLIILAEGETNWEYTPATMVKHHIGLILPPQ